MAPETGVRLRGQLLEREAELDEAATLLSSAREGVGSALLIEGPAGIGKSALIAAIRERAADEGLAVLSARGAELEREFSFGVVRQLFESALARASDDDQQALLAGAAGLAGPAIGTPDRAAPPESAPTADPSFAV